MLIGHLPAGYILAPGAQRAGASRALFAGILIGSLAPDLDMLWFLFVDHGSIHHHDYITHRPLFWAIVLALGLVMRQGLVIGTGIGGFFHLCLDSIAGKVTWGWPVFDTPTTLVIVPATQSHWILSFLLHWTFAVELAVTAFAAWLFMRTRRRKETP